MSVFTRIIKMMQSSVLVMLVAASSVHCNMTLACSQEEICHAYLDVATDMIAKAKYNIPTCTNCTKIWIKKAIDCADILEMGLNKSGVYQIWPTNRMMEGKSIYVFCDMDTDGGGWTVIQRRGDFGTPKDYFYQNWESYKEGFGKLEQDFLLGNDNIFALTNQKLNSVRFDLKDVQQNRRYALYSKFWIDDENNKYKLHISVHTGDAGDSMTYSNNQRFSTFDQDNEHNCAKNHKGAWWYLKCKYANLNGLYYKGKHTENDGLTWFHWKGNFESLEWTEIKIRPRHFRAASSYEERNSNGLML